MERKDGTRTDMEYEIIRSSRRTMGLEIKNGRVIVRAPRRASDRSIRRFVQEHETWIRTRLEKLRAREEALGTPQPLTEEEMRILQEKARAIIPLRVAFYAPRVGVTYGRITIRCQKTRWGSCSSAGNLNFNWLLMLAPMQVLDSVVVHELCHRLEPNHSARFYAHVLRVFPEYREWNNWLKENGSYLMARVPGRD
nr:M48 family metallopeptidase [Lachnospiraceae bacterium]